MLGIHIETRSKLAGFLAMLGHRHLTKEALKRAVHGVITSDRLWLLRLHQQTPIEQLLDSFPKLVSKLALENVAPAVLPLGPQAGDAEDIVRLCVLQHSLHQPLKVTMADRIICPAC